MTLCQSNSDQILVLLPNPVILRSGEAGVQRETGAPQKSPLAVGAALGRASGYCGNKRGGSRGKCGDSAGGRVSSVILLLLIIPLCHAAPVSCVGSANTRLPPPPPPFHDSAAVSPLAVRQMPSRGFAHATGGWSGGGGADGSRRLLQ